MALLRAPHFKRFSIGSLSFSVVSLSEAVDSFSRPLEVGCKRGMAVHFCNAYSVALAESSLIFREIVSRGDVVCCDGVPIIWVGKMLSGGQDLMWERVYGPDVLRAVLSDGIAHGARHYFLGGSEMTLKALIARVSVTWSGCQIVGFESPPFRELSRQEIEEQVARIRNSGATHVWVGLGQPKQDFATAYLAKNLVAKVFAVGAAFDFVAGVKPQAPKWMQRSGTEWMFRLGSEPGRLLKRYFWGNPMFLYSVAKGLVVHRP